MNILRKTLGLPQSQRQLKQGIFNLVAAVAAAGAIAAIAKSALSAKNLPSPGNPYPPAA